MLLYSNQHFLSIRQPVLGAEARARKFLLRVDICRRACLQVRLWGSSQIFCHFCFKKKDNYQTNSNYPSFPLPPPPPTTMSTVDLSGKRGRAAERSRPIQDKGQIFSTAVFSYKQRHAPPL